MFRATLCSSSGASIVSIQHLVYVTLCRWPFRVQVGKFLSDLHTKRSPTQSDIYQMLYWYIWFSWWWARDCSNYVENWNKYIEKKCASRWSFTMNHNKMHGQQNIKFSRHRYFQWRIGWIINTKFRRNRSYLLFLFQQYYYNMKHHYQQRFV